MESEGSLSVCDVRSVRDAVIESDHFLVRVKIRLKIKGSEKTKKSETQKWDMGKLNKKEVKEEFIMDVTANTQNTPLEEVKSKAIPLQDWTGPGDSRRLRRPDFKTSAHEGGTVVSPMHWPPLPPGNIPGTVRG